MTEKVTGSESGRDIMRLSDSIESFIKQMIGAAEDDGIELRRNELAEYFHCAPSQINYVLSTRFTPEHGYMIESRRGGGGCIRIIHVETSPADHLDYLIRERVGSSLTEPEARLLLRQLTVSNTISAGDASMIAAALSPQSMAVPIPEEMKAVLRAKIMRNMLLTVIRRVQAEHRSTTALIIQERK